MPALLAALVALLVNAARQYLPGIIGRLLLAIGIGFAADKLVVPSLIAFVQSNVSGMPSLIAAYFSAIGLDKACTIILSALAAEKGQKLILKKLS